MRWASSLSEVEAVLAGLPEAARFHYPLRHGSMRVGVYVPASPDLQTPHPQDELYIVARGRGWFVKSGTRVAVQAQDVLFVEAGAPHCFEDVSDDFATWVIFWGPDGGEG
jgi:mannose-6-phosphate isomerase-like protein (cupin superfamily)